jgi:hypothetical protein
MAKGKAHLNFTSSARSPHAEPRPAATPLRCRAHLLPCKEYRAARLPIARRVTARSALSSAFSAMRPFFGPRLITADNYFAQVFSWAS